MKLDSKDLALTSIFASLYAVINIFQTAMGGPITYGPIQLRLADSLIPLSALFGMPLVVGVSIGCFSNAYYWLDPADIVVGPLVNFAAAFLIFYLRRHRSIACVSGALTVGIPIGLYLYSLCIQGNPALQQVPMFPGLTMPAWGAFVLSLSVSSFITIAVIGYILLSALMQPSVIELLRSHGLRVYTETST